MLKYQLNRDSAAWNRWSGFYEDVPYNPRSLNQATPTLTAQYLLSHPAPESVDPVVGRARRGAPPLGAEVIRPRPVRSGRGESTSSGHPASPAAARASGSAARRHAGRRRTRCSMRTRVTNVQRGARRPFAELRDVFRRERRTRLVLRATTDEHVLVQRRVRRLSAELQLGDGRDARARAQAAQPPARLELGRAIRVVRPPQGHVPDLRRERHRGAPTGFRPRRIVAGGSVLSEHSDLSAEGYVVQALGRRRLRSPDPPRRRAPNRTRRPTPARREGYALALARGRALPPLRPAAFFCAVVPPWLATSGEPDATSCRRGSTRRGSSRSSPRAPSTFPCPSGPRTASRS